MNNIGRMAFIILFAVSVLVACAAKPVLTIQYNVPDSTTTLKGINAGMVFIDQRSDTNVLDEAAGEQLKDFTGNFALLTEPDSKTEKDNVRSVSALFQKAVAKRLEVMGVMVSRGKDKADVTLSLILKTFKLEFVDGSWKATINYEAQLLSGDEVRAREEIEGSAERVKIIGTDDADKVMGKLFSDTINKLNLEHMFKKAGMG